MAWDVQLPRRLTSLARSPLAASTVALMAAQVVSGLLGFLFWGVLSRSFPTGLVGQATTLVAVASALTLLTTAGLAPALLLAVPRTSSDGERAAVAWVAAGAAAGFSAVTAVVAALALPRVNDNLAFLGDGALPWVLVAVTVTSAASNVIDPVVTAAHRPGLVPVRALLFSGSKAVLLWVLVTVGVAPAVATGVSWAVCAAGSGWLVLHLLHRGTRATGWGEAFTVLRAGLGHHHVASLGGGLPPLLLPLMVTAALGTSDNARFTLAWMVAASFFMVSPAVASASIAHTAADGHVSKQQLRHAALLIAGIVTGPVIVAVGFGAPLLGLFGPSYRSAAPLLALLALSVVPDAVTNLAVASARVRGDLRRATTVNTAIGVTTLAAAALLLPSTGLLAPGIGWCLGQGAGTVVVLASAWRNRRQNTPV